MAALLEIRGKVREEGRGEAEREEERWVDGRRRREKGNRI